jgi:CHAD domain-containing protein
MSFELRSGESVRKGIRRITRKQLQKALEQLTGRPKEGRDEAVHSARKSFKRIRAILRLVRPEIGERTYHAENLSFRDAARPLTEVRDARIVLDTVEQLAEHFKKQIGVRVFKDTRQALEANLRAVRKRVLDEQEARAIAAEAVRQSQKRIKDWADVPNKWRAIGQGLENVYRRALNAFEDASADPIVEKLHELRKQAKYLRYQLEVLRPLWPERMQELAEEADRLTKLLGDDHDLVILRQMLDSGRAGSGEEREVLIPLMDERRAELQQEAMQLGGCFFQEPAKEFVGLIKGYWKTWRARKQESNEVVAVS